jgi:colanic acid/amylovoran biosynthesis glycosyltransferase
VTAVLAEFGSTGVDVMEACYGAGVPLVVRFGGADAYAETPKWRNYRRFYLPLFAIASAVVAVSRDMLRQLALLGCSPDKLRYCPSGASLSLFDGAAPSLAPPIFVAVGRFVDKKAPYLTLLAFRTVLQACPEAKLIMAGNGYLLDACGRLAKALQIAHAVDFRGACSHEDVAALMRTARCFVQHSVRTNDGDSEGTPNSVIEASAAGLPVIATRHAGIPDVVIDGETGWLVNEGDVDGMAAHMLRMARDPQAAQRIGERARERIGHEFTLEKSIEALWEIIAAARDGGRPVFYQRQSR